MLASPFVPYEEFRSFFAIHRWGSEVWGQDNMPYPPDQVPDPRERGSKASDRAPDHPQPHLCSRSLH